MIDLQAFYTSNPTSVTIFLISQKTDRSIESDVYDGGEDDDFDYQYQYCVGWSVSFFSTFALFSRSIK